MRPKQNMIINLSNIEFINRPKEIGLFEKQLVLMKDGSETAKPVIHYWGIPGIGKSTILHEIYKKNSTLGFEPIFIDFKDFHVAPKRLSDMKICEAFIEELFKKIPRTGYFHGHKVGKKARSSAPLENNVLEELAKDLVTSLATWVSLHGISLAVLLIDSAEYSTPEVFQWIERNVFSPLLTTKKFMILVASQTPRDWAMFDVRQSSIEQKVQPFDLSAVRQHLGYEDRANKDLAEQIFSITYGVPACNVLVMNSIREDRRKKFTIHNYQDLNVGKLVHKEVQYFWGKSVKKIDSEIKYILVLISQLRWFDYALLQEILVSVKPEKYMYFKPSMIRKITRRLEETNFVNWDIQDRGFAMDFTMRRILFLDLKINNPSVFSQTQTVILEWFRRLTEEYDLSFLYFLDLIYYYGLYGKFEAMLKQADDAILEIEIAQSNDLEKVMNIEQILRALEDKEFQEAIPVEYIAIIRERANDSLVKLLRD